MDLSAVIFVVLALAWAVYLIPKALSHHDEMASDRLVEGHSDKVRILSRKRSIAVTETVVETVPDAEEPAATTVAPVRAASAASASTPSTLLPTRASARRAARNRRRVLSVLVVALAAVVALAGFSIVPWWSTAVPGTLVVAFLVVARLSVRRMQQARTPRHAALPAVDLGQHTESGSQASSAPQPAIESALEELTEDTVGVDRAQLEAALADDGSLWDPLPMTLPTYVSKARARRTVRTIELTGISSSGHDEGDSTLAREAESAGVEAESAEAAQRRVAGA